MKTFLFAAIFIFSFGIGFSQTTIENLGFLPEERGAKDGTVKIWQDSRLNAIVKKHIQTNNKTFPGFRVQIYFGSGNQAMNQANSLKTAFLNKYGKDYGSYIVYDAPYFKLRVGDFRSRAEAICFQHKIAKVFPNAWVVPDVVGYPEEM